MFSKLKIIFKFGKLVLQIRLWRVASCKSPCENGLEAINYSIISDMWIQYCEKRFY